MDRNPRRSTVRVLGEEENQKKREGGEEAT